MHTLARTHTLLPRTLMWMQNVSDGKYDAVYTRISVMRNRLQLIGKLTSPAPRTERLYH